MIVTMSPKMPTTPTAAARTVRTPARTLFSQIISVPPLAAALPFRLIAGAITMP